MWNGQSKSSSTPAGFLPFGGEKKNASPPTPYQASTTSSFGQSSFGSQSTPSSFGSQVPTPPTPDLTALQAKVDQLDRKLNVLHQMLMQIGNMVQQMYNTQGCPPQFGTGSGPPRPSTPPMQSLLSQSKSTSPWT